MVCGGVWWCVGVVVCGGVWVWCSGGAVVMVVVCGGVWVYMLDLGLILTIYPKQRTSQLHAVPRTPCAVLFARVHAHHMPIGARFRWYIMFPPPSSGDLANHDHGAVNENTMVMTMPVRKTTRKQHTTRY